MSKSVTEQWQAIVEQITTEVHKGTVEGMQSAVRKGAKLLRQTSPVDPSGKRAGKYARGWTSTVEEYAGLTAEAYIYNKTDWQLTHLLEDGHDVKNRFSKGVIGHYSGNRHIADAERSVYAILLEEIPVRISRGLK